MNWITRDKVKVDRVACPWLIKKFVDPQAEFLFVAAEEVAAKTKELGATPSDIWRTRTSSCRYSMRA